MAHSVNLDDDALLLLDGRCDTRTQTLIDQVKEQRAFTERHAFLRGVKRPEQDSEMQTWAFALEAALIEAHAVIRVAEVSGDETTPGHWLDEVGTTIETVLGFGPDGPERPPVVPPAG